MAFARRNLRVTYVVYILTTIATLDSTGAVLGKTLYEDYKELRNIIRIDKIGEIVHKYRETDHEAREFLRRLQDPVIYKYAHWLYKQPPLHKVLNYLEEHKVPGYALVNEIMSPFSWPPLIRPGTRPTEGPYPEGQHPEGQQPKRYHSDGHQPVGHRRHKRSVHRMTQEIRAHFSLLELVKFYSQKMRTSKEFKGLVIILRSDEFNNMVLAAMQHEGYKKLTVILEEGGLDIDGLRRSLTIMFGWGHREKKKYGGLLGKIFSKLG